MSLNTTPHAATAQRIYDPCKLGVLLQKMSLAGCHQVYGHHQLTWMIPSHPIMKCMTVSLGVVCCEVELLVNAATHIANVTLYSQMLWDEG